MTYISEGSTGWATTSTRAAKTNIDAVDPQAVLAGVETLTLATWDYEAADGDGEGVRHIGPMADEFHDAFDVGASETAINSADANGVALAAIQGLSTALDESEARIDELEGELDRLAGENEQLRERVAVLEEQVADLACAAGGSAATADG